MNMRNLIPWNRHEDRVPTTFRDGDPFLALHREVNRLFDAAFRSFDTPAPFSRLATGRGAWPSVEVDETDGEIRVTAEVPGLEEKDMEVLDGILTLRGERKSETEDKDRQFSERFYGRFERQINLGYEIDEDKVSATFENGVLTVNLPKTEQAQAKAKRIAITGRN